VWFVENTLNPYSTSKKNRVGYGNCILLVTNLLPFVDMFVTDTLARVSHLLA